MLHPVLVGPKASIHLHPSCAEEMSIDNKQWRKGRTCKDNDDVP